MVNNKIDWDKETDPRRYCFGHSLYRRLVSIVTGYQLRVKDNPERVEEANKTMELLNDNAKFVGVGGKIAIFKFSLGQEVLCHERSGRIVKCVILGQLVASPKDVKRPYICYLTNKHLMFYMAEGQFRAIPDEDVEGAQ